MVALRLFIPVNWTSDPVRLKRAGVPIEHRSARSKPEIALAEIDRVIAAGVRFGCVLADAGYGSSAPFRHALSERGLLWAVGMSRRQKVYPTDVTMIFPTEKARKPRKHHIPDMSPVSAETMLVGVKWQKISWRGGTKGPLTCLFAARRVRIADGPKHRMFDKVSSVCLAMKCGSWANDDRAESRSTTSRICPLTFRLRRWQLPSRRGGSVNRRISN